MKVKYIRVLFAVLATILVSVFASGKLGKSSEKTNISDVENVYTNECESELKTRLNVYDIELKGETSEFTQFQLEGLIDRIQPSDQDIIKKYTNLSEKCTGNITLSYEELFELIYYGYTADQRESFLNDAKHQRVDVLSNNGAIGLSYNIE